MHFLSSNLVIVCISSASSASLDIRGGSDVRLASESFTLPRLDFHDHKWNLQSSSYQDHTRRPLIRTSADIVERDVLTSRTFLASLLLFNLIAFAMIFFLLSHSQSPSNAKSATTTDLKKGGTSLLERALGPGQMKMNAYPLATALGAQDATNVTQRLQWHLSRELPLHAHKATAHHAISEKELLRFIKTRFENDAESRSELASVIAARSGGIVAEDGWWSWMHRAPLSTPVRELMRDFHCDGLLDWSRVPPSALADSYMQIIVTSGVGSKAMLHEGEDTDWLQSLHRDVFHDWSLRGLRHFFVPKVDTLLVGCIGRKKIVMLPPHAMTPGR